MYLLFTEDFQIFVLTKEPTHEELQDDVDYFIRIIDGKAEFYDFGTWLPIPEWKYES